MDKIACIVLNYNMPESVDAIVKHFKQYVAHPHDLIVVENGSDKHAPTKHASIRLEKNVQITHGWLMGHAYAQALAHNSGEHYLAYWFISTSMIFDQPVDYVAMMAEVLNVHQDAYAVTPAWVGKSGELKAWTHRLLEWNKTDEVEERIYPTAGCVHRAWMFDSFGGFDKRLTYNWGADIDLAFKAQLAGYTMYVHNGARIKIVENAGYKLKRMGMTADKRKQLSYQQMDEVMSEKWPELWPKVREDEQLDIRLHH